MEFCNLSCNHLLSSNELSDLEKNIKSTIIVETERKELVDSLEDMTFCSLSLSRKEKKEGLKEQKRKGVDDTAIKRDVDKLQGK